MTTVPHLRGVTKGVGMEIYHCYSKSIAGYRIFTCERDFTRIKEMLSYYKYEKPILRFSYYRRFLERAEKSGKDIAPIVEVNKTGKQLVQIIAYCIMPTHIHLILKEMEERGVSVFMNNLFNSYSRYFNIKMRRKGPLWEKRFSKVQVESDEQLLHLTRYLHLNPVTSYIVNNPIEWNASSYHEYLGRCEGEKICKFDDVLEIDPAVYEAFVNENIDLQREYAQSNAQNGR